MSTTSSSAWIDFLCNKHDLYEYRTLILVKMLDGHQFVTDNAKVAKSMQLAYGAETVTVNVLKHHRS